MCWSPFILICIGFFVLSTKSIEQLKKKLILSVRTTQNIHDISIKHVTLDRRISKKEQRRQIMPMHGRSTETTSVTESRSRWNARGGRRRCPQSIYMNICRVKTSLWPYHMPPANISGSSDRPDETIITPSTSMYSICSPVICSYNLVNFHVRRIQLHPRSVSVFSTHTV